jgi:hypothetical protein
MTALPYFILFFAGSLMTLAVQAVLMMWRNPKPKLLVEVPNE